MIHRTAFRATLMPAAAAFMLGGCAPEAPKPVPKQSASGKALPEHPAADKTLEVISIIADPCEGTCPAYKVSIFADGRGMFEGLGYTEVKGKRAFALKPGQFASVAAILAPYRPDDKRSIQEGAPECGTFATDLPGRQVLWRATDGTQETFDYNMGCVRAPAAPARAIEEAIAAIPIADFIEKHGNGTGSTIVK